jgi:hypothetical protein
MIRDDEHWLTLTDAFQEAAFDGSVWYGALAAFAQVTGSQHSQLVCMGEDATMPLNLLTNVDPALPAAFVAAGGTDPRVNPRRRAGLSRPPLTIIAESDFITPDECKQDAHYQEFARSWTADPLNRSWTLAACRSAQCARRSRCCLRGPASIASSSSWLASVIYRTASQSQTQQRIVCVARCERR